MNGAEVGRIRDGEIEKYKLNEIVALNMKEKK